MTLLSALRRRGSAETARARRPFPLEVGSLEGRALLSGPGDATAPVTTAFVSGIAGQNGYFRGPVTVSLAASDVDDAPGTLATFFSVNGSPFVSGRSVSLSNDGMYAVSYFSVDPAGQVEATRTQFVAVDHTAPAVGAVASPTMLWPPNNKFVPVRVSGHVADNFAGVASSVSYSVVDEYGRVQPTGTASVDGNGNYSFVVLLQASRLGQDRDGRQYLINVSARDQAGNLGTTTAVVTVPHDQGNHRGRESKGGRGHSGKAKPIVILPGSDDGPDDRQKGKGRGRQTGRGK